VDDPKLVVPEPLSGYQIIENTTHNEIGPTLVMLLFLLGHRLGDDLVDWNSGVSVRPSVRPYVRPSVRPQKVFSISI